MQSGLRRTETSASRSIENLHNDQYLRFDPHQPLEHKLGVIKTPQHWAKEVPTTSQGTKKEQGHLKTAPVATHTGPSPRPPENETPRKKRREINGTAFPSHICLDFQKNSGEFSKNMTSWCSTNPPTPSDRDWSTPQSNVVYAVQGQEECNKLYNGETKQPLHKPMAQHRWATSSGQVPAVHLHLKESGHSFEDNQGCVLATEECWFERGVKEAIHVKLEKPSLNQGGGLRHFQSHM